MISLSAPEERLAALEEHLDDLEQMRSLNRHDSLQESTHGFCLKHGVDFIVVSVAGTTSLVFSTRSMSLAPNIAIWEAANSSRPPAI